MVLALTILFGFLLLTTQLFGVNSHNQILDLLMIPITIVVKIIGYIVTVLLFIYILIIYFFGLKKSRHQNNREV